MTRLAKFYGKNIYINIYKYISPPIIPTNYPHQLFTICTNEGKGGANPYFSEKADSMF